MATMEIPVNLLEGWDIVVLEDEQDSLEVAEIILNEYGANVHTASNGKDGLDVVRQTNPRFVISDLSMPVMDGWGFISGMKADGSLSNIPVIALTAHAMVGDRERALAAGCDDYLTKPIDLSLLAVKITNLMT